jgi:protocatechuate 3,4-dioxygenase beta subunit
MLPGDPLVGSVGRHAMASYCIGDLSRREILKMSAVLASVGILSPAKLAWAEAKLRRTPAQVLGPFYPITNVWAKTPDLTRPREGSGQAAGQVLQVTGRVLNLSGEPVRDAKIEVWQANTYGRYRHPSDNNPAPLDPNFDGAGVLTTDAEGRYGFKTIKPGAYPAGPNMMRPPHIHFQVTGREDRLVTQMYFEHEPYNDTDRLLNSAERKELLIAKLLPPSPDLDADSKRTVFDIVLLRG